jgi:hypothetical protein
MGAGRVLEVLGVLGVLPWALATPTLAPASPMLATPATVSLRTQPVVLMLASSSWAPMGAARHETGSRW